MASAYDVVVIGLGGVGSFALRALSKEFRGKKILGLERYHLSHTKGSSHGESRIFRRAYFEDEGYISWIVFSIQEWEKLEQESGRSLLNRCGNLILQDKPDDDNASTGDSKNYLRLAMDAAEKHGIQAEFLNQEELKKRYPQFRYHSNTELIGLLEPDAGFVRPELAMSTALAQAQAEDSVTIWEQARVESMKQLPEEGVEIEVCRHDGKEKVMVSAKTVLVAAGAWTPQIIPSWSKHLTVTRQCQGWVDVSSQSTSTPDDDTYMPQNFPTWILATKNYPLPFFGVPVTTTAGTTEQQYIKVGVHNDVDKIEDPSSNPSTCSPAELEEYQRAVKLALDLNEEDLSERLKMQPCMYTMTPDENFLMGVPKGYKDVYAIAGLSGHGFKMTPALGQILADFALMGEEQLNAKWHPNRFCSPSRFDAT